MEHDLIYDVGLHTGEDTDFYLRKGFRVIAVEANPVLIAAAEHRFSREIANGALAIIKKAIATNSEGVRFAINSREPEWGTIDPDYAKRNEAVGTTNSWVDLPSTRFDTILKEYGIPHYLKVDIEGADILCIDALSQFNEKPAFLSVEITFFCFSDYFNLISQLWCLGYKKFKIINQALVKGQICPNPPCEGTYIEHSFGKGSSGLFGNESPGAWVDVEETFRKADKLAKLMQLHSPLSGRLRNTLYSRYYRYLHEKVTGEPIAWYDLHASI